MIILDEEPPSSKISSYSHVAGPTLRFPDRVACHSTTSLSLPDYETSQALANNDLVYKKVVNKKVDTRYVYHRQCYGFGKIALLNEQQVLAGDSLCFDHLYRSFCCHWYTNSSHCES